MIPLSNIKRHTVSRERLRIVKKIYAINIGKIRYMNKCERGMEPTPAGGKDIDNFTPATSAAAL